MSENDEKKNDSLVPYILSWFYHPYIAVFIFFFFFYNWADIIEMIYYGNKSAFDTLKTNYAQVFSINFSNSCYFDFCLDFNTNYLKIIFSSIAYFFASAFFRNFKNWVDLLIDSLWTRINEWANRFEYANKIEELSNEIKNKSIIEDCLNYFIEHIGRSYIPSNIIPDRIKNQINCFFFLQMDEYDARFIGKFISFDPDKNSFSLTSKKSKYITAYVVSEVFNIPSTPRYKNAVFLCVFQGDILLNTDTPFEPFEDLGQKVGIYSLSPTDNGNIEIGVKNLTIPELKKISFLNREQSDIDKIYFRLYDPEWSKYLNNLKNRNALIFNYNEDYLISRKANVFVRIFRDLKQKFKNWIR